jgi:hypothetical protein
MIAAALDQRACAIKDDKRNRNKAANFLKHADRDANKSLAVDELDFMFVIADAINMWGNLNLPFTDEMWAYQYWFRGTTAQKPEEFINTKEGPIHLFTFEQKVEFGQWLLRLTYSKAGRSPERFRGDALQLPAGRFFTALSN